jgi:hypothetical protein
MDPSDEPNQTENDPDGTEYPRPWMPTFWANWLRQIKVRPWPWMPTLAALILLLLYLLRRLRRQSS